jgi:hypothetical protein
VTKSNDFNQNSNLASLIIKVIELKIPSFSWGNQRKSIHIDYKIDLVQHLRDNFRRKEDDHNLELIPAEAK